MRIGNFLRDRNGSVAPMFALAVLPVFGFMGAAVDFSRTSAVRADMQAALDATALMLSKDTAALTDGTLQAKALAYFQAQFNRPEAKNIQIAAVYTKSGGATLRVDGGGTLPTSFMKLIGVTTMDFAASATVTWGSTKLQVALALDNTGSMSSAGKIGALKTATKDLLKQLQDAAQNPNDVLVSIVPFSKDVNVGSGNYGANWIDWEDWDDENGHDQTSTTCTNSKGKKKRCTTSTTWVPDNHNTWNGCVTDRNKDYDVTNTKPTSSNKSTLFPAEQYDECPVPLMTLTNNWSQLKGLVDQMQPAGTTNQTIGLAWAWLTLTQGPPLNAPAPPADTQQVIILLSDGLNTENRWDGNGWQVSPEVDARMAKVCTNVKAAKIQIYAIHVNTDGDPTSQILKDCATKSDMFFELKSSGQILTTFNAIGTQISKLRISK